MYELSPSAERICKAAIDHFSVFGYDASSLNTIAADVGIKKPSLYAHFKNKDDLFLSCLDITIQSELKFMDERFRISNYGESPGKNYAVSLAKRYENAVEMRFLLRTVYLPPAILKIEIAKKYMKFIDCLTDLFHSEINKKSQPQISEELKERFTQVYIGIIDSILIEVVHQSYDIAMKRFGVLWTTLEEAMEYRNVLKK